MRDLFPVLVHAVLWRDAEILLLRRARTGYLDGWYALPGGHLERGEGVVDAVVRECREETGLELDPRNVKALAVLPYLTDGQQGVNLLFTCRTFAGEARLAEPERFDDLRWCRSDGLPERTVPYLAEALRMHARGQWFREFVG